ncbi:MAG: hypothetical protein F4X04_16715 [Holophagales bacterium]|nr:hypothetical protein [Holophagales bacterium]MYD23857.1 hypothetical protein [Holophagales bacterium]
MNTKHLAPEPAARQPRNLTPLRVKFGIPERFSAWAWENPREAATILFNNIDELPNGRANEHEIREYIDARIQGGTPLHLLGSLAAVKAAESAGKLDESLTRFVCEWPQE